MKKIVRTVCIGLLSGLAFLAACTSSKTSAKPEANAANQEEINEMNARLNRIEQRIKEMKNPDAVDRKTQLQQQLDSINNIIQRREGASIYGSPEVMEKYRNETLRLHKEASQIQKELEDLNKE